MRISRQLKLVTLITVLALGTALLLGGWNLWQLRQNFAEYRNSQQGSRLLLAMKADMLGVSRADPVLPETAGRLAATASRVQQGAGALATLLDAEQARQLQALLDSRWQNYLKQFQSAVQIAESSPQDALSIPEQIYRIELEPLITEFDQLLGQQTRRAGELDDKIAVRIRHVLLAVLIPLSVAAVLIVLSQLGFARRLQRQLRDMDVIVQGLRGGNLTRRMPTPADELGELGHAINTFIDNLHKVLAQTQKASQGMREDARSVSHLADEVSGYARQQQRQIEEILDASGTMSIAISQVSQQAEQASNAAGQARAAAHSAQAAGHATTGNLASLSGEFRLVEDSMQQLTQAFGRIVSVSEAIKDITEQTNLLALNAAIEAARAGEAGRGFAVVADEVRKLSQTTAESTRNIQRILSDTRSITERTQQSVLNASTLLATCNADGQTVSAAFGHIHEVVSQVSGMMDAIASAVEEQTAVAGAIEERVAGMAEGIRTTAADSQAMRDEMQGLRELSDELEGSMQAFRLA
ncbi:methyl-accepting chemotaxis protein [Chitinilyticum litopenaei]|uniref:methyl-accepting chemotaxis protein n=1 Tax=Chitinilyticum litopenaei TaxID=1121276 RepID=UPI000421F981|nr:methyl-accepting chemotaxis protein [Chitinilyticum litopenaei]